MEILRLLLTGDKQGRPAIIDQLPMALLVIVGIAVYWSGASLEQPPRIDLVIKRASELSGTELALLIALVPIASVFLQPLQIFLLRVLEGSWPHFLQMLSKPLLSWQKFHYHRLRKERPWFPPIGQTRQVRQARALLYRRFPDERRILPTRLGNALRAAEDRAGQRYNLDTYTIWPRMRCVLPDGFTNSVSQARDEFDLSARFAATFLVIGVATTILLARQGWWLICPLFFILSASVAYNSAVQAAIRYGEVLGVAFDLYRFELLQALHFPLPSNMAEERWFNQELTRFFINNRPIYADEVKHRYQHHQLDDSREIVEEELPRMNLIHKMIRTMKR